MYKYFVSFTFQKTGSGGTGYANTFLETTAPLDSQEMIQNASAHIASALQKKTGDHVAAEKVVVINFQRV
jgi:hypothetical protein